MSLHLQRPALLRHHGSSQNHLQNSTEPASLSMQGGQPERKDFWPPSGGHFPGHLQVCLLGGVSATCGFHHGLSSHFRSEEQTVKFMGLMNSTWVLDGHDIATAFNLSCFQNIVDLGGQILNSLLLPQTTMRPLCVHVRVFC